jgi:hypothetical protein
MRIRIQAPQKQDNVVLAIKKFFIAIVQGKLIGKNLAEKTTTGRYVIFVQTSPLKSGFSVRIGDLQDEFSGDSSRPQACNTGP